MEQDREGAPDVGQTADAPGDAPDTFSIGELVNGQYAVVARISEGPTGKLYRTQNVKTASEVTLKLLRGWSGPDKTLHARVSEELSVTRTLARTHPAIAQVYGCDQTPDGRTFVVLERLEGRNLAELIRRREPLSVERALDLTVQVARGLHAAHSLRLFHGAIGAEHVFVQPDDVVKVLGFEVARREAVNRASAQPPSERRDVLTEAADIKAVAMMLLEMLTAGVRPGPNGAAPHLEAPRGGEVPPEVKQLVMRALVPPPGPSHLDMEGLATALSAPLERRREPPRSRALRRVRRSPHARPWRLVGARAFAIMGIASAGLVAWSVVKMPRSPATHEMPRDSGGPKAPNLAASSPDTGVQPRSGEGVVGLPPGEEARIPSGPGKAAPETDSTAVDPPAPVVPPAPVATPAPAAPARPRETAARAPSGGGSVRTESEPPPVRVRAAPEAESPAVERQTPVTQPGPRETATRAPSGGSAPTESDAPDPSAIIDWLIKAKGRPSGGP